MQRTVQSVADLSAMVDDEFFKLRETGPHHISPIEELDEIPSFTKCTDDTFEGILNNNRMFVLSVHDRLGENIQLMDHVRRNYNYYRKYTFGDMTAYYNEEDKKVYVQGLVDGGNLEYIYVLALYEVDEDNENTDEDGDDEENIKIPAWMVPTIKQRIINNELAFMLNRPSDDSNNATLASVKPHGPQD